MEIKGVVHCQKDEYDVYIGRPSKWGNPFPIGDGMGSEDYRMKHTGIDVIGMSREEVIIEYRRYILGNQELLDQLHELDGKVLGCWCAPKSCHGDILAELVKMVNDYGKFYYIPKF